MPTKERLNELYQYDGATGTLRFRRSQGAKKKGSLVGCLTEHGYYATRVQGRFEYVHRIIWTMHYGPIPAGFVIDHKDRVRSNNTIANLRAVCNGDNIRNSGRPHPGVAYYPRLGRWRAYICIANVRHDLGYHPTMEEALAVRAAAEVRLGVAVVQ